MSMNDNDLQNDYDSAVSEARYVGVNDAENWRDLSENTKKVLTFFADAIENRNADRDPREDPRPWVECDFDDIQSGFLVRGDKRSEFIADHMRNGMWVNADDTKSVHVNTRGLQMVEFYEDNDDDYDCEDDQGCYDCDYDPSICDCGVYEYDEEDYDDEKDQNDCCSKNSDCKESKSQRVNGVREYAVLDENDSDEEESTQSTNGSDSEDTADLHSERVKVEDIFNKFMSSSENGVDELMNLISDLFEGSSEDREKRRQDRINRLKRNGYYKNNGVFPPFDF